MEMFLVARSRLALAGRKWCVCCALLLAVQLVVSPIILPSAAEDLSGANESSQSTFGQSGPFVDPATVPEGLVMGFVLEVNELQNSKNILGDVGLYLQEQLAMPVKMRSFDSDGQLYNWLARFREVDFAWLSQDFLKGLPVGDVSFLAKPPKASGHFPYGELVAHPGLGSELRQRVSDVFLGMEQAASGRELLNCFRQVLP